MGRWGWVALAGDLILDAGKEALFLNLVARGFADSRLGTASDTALCVLGRTAYGEAPW